MGKITVLPLIVFKIFYFFQTSRFLIIILAWEVIYEDSTLGTREIPTWSHLHCKLVFSNPLILHPLYCCKFQCLTCLHTTFRFKDLLLHMKHITWKSGLFPNWALTKDEVYLFMRKECNGVKRLMGVGNIADQCGVWWRWDAIQYGPYGPFSLNIICPSSRCKNYWWMLFKRNQGFFIMAFSDAISQ